MTDAILLLSQYNQESPLPSLFTLFASNYVSKMLWDVFHAGHSSLCTRYTQLMGSMGYSRELFTLMMVGIESNYLWSNECGFSENFFGLKRTGVRLSNTPPAPNAAFGASLAFPPLQGHQKLVSLMELTFIPYVCGKLEQQYVYYTSDQPDTILVRRAQARRLAEARGLWWRFISLLYRFYVKALVKAFPLVYGLYKAIHVTFMAAYALEKTIYASPIQYLGGLTLRRTTMADQREASQGRSNRMVAVAGLALSGIFLMLRYSEWSSRGRSTTGIVLETEVSATVKRPPTTVLETAAQSEGKCCVCHQQLVNPSVLIGSGVVGCYVCLQEYVDKYKCCPLTGQPALRVHIRRLYEG